MPSPRHTLRSRHISRSFLAGTHGPSAHSLTRNRTVKRTAAQRKREKEWLAAFKNPNISARSISRRNTVASLARARNATKAAQKAKIEEAEAKKKEKAKLAKKAREELAEARKKQESEAEIQRAVEKVEAAKKAELEANKDVDDLLDMFSGMKMGGKRH
jgi:hypothetical protein